MSGSPGSLLLFLFFSASHALALCFPDSKLSCKKESSPPPLRGLSIGTEKYTRTRPGRRRRRREGWGRRAGNGVEDPREYLCPCCVRSGKGKLRICCCVSGFLSRTLSQRRWRREENGERYLFDPRRGARKGTCRLQPPGFFS
jgi:hypothetical protein